MIRILTAVALAAAVLPAGASAAVRTEPAGPPGLRVHLADGALKVTGEARPGPLRLTLTGAETASVAIVELAPGHTAAELGDIGTEFPAAVERIGRFVAGTVVKPGVTYRTTIIARARDYVAVDMSVQYGARVTFKVAGVASFATLPRTDALVKITDDGFELPAVLPRSGVIRVDNIGRIAHRAMALRIPRGISTRRAIVTLRRGRITGMPTSLTGLVSPGTTNRVQVALKPGRYVLVSLGGDVIYAATRVR